MLKNVHMSLKFWYSSFCAVSLHAPMRRRARDGKETPPVPYQLIYAFLFIR
jgi:hypothetical protein